LLNVNPVNEEVTVTVAVAKAQVGCVTLTVGTVGVAGCTLILPVAAVEIQPLAFLAVML